LYAIVRYPTLYSNGLRQNPAEKSSIINPLEHESGHRVSNTDKKWNICS